MHGHMYDDSGNINRSIDIHAKKEYNYEYEEGKIIRAAESDITLNGELVIGRTLVNTVRYYYNTEGQLTKKVITPAGKASFTYTYTNTENATTVQFTAFFMGETYKGFKTQNWYTVINGLGAGYLTSAVARAISTVISISRSYTTFKLQIVGFAHTHPVNHSNSPSGPDVWMKRLGWIVSLRIFPIAV